MKIIALSIGGREEFSDIIIANGINIYYGQIIF